ncbi:succinyl-CoA:glutarate CoA-transferase isoform X2 [Engystomops pustulosus]|uniref:succinyl-CoA:glutarate CoA-transferase isoform X2 n=1 Tax=Engystomops pustulosus TaxID=76066 RepID=UPI003AFB0EC9
MHGTARLLEAMRRSNTRAKCGASLFTSHLSQQHPVCTQLRQSQTDSGSKKPLDGVKILDLTRVLAGPFATMILGDLGAEVIKVEKPGSGDDTRSWGPPFVASESAYFLSVNRNKKSIAVNMKKPKGTRIIKQLAQACDVLIENYIPGKLAEMGLGYEDLMETSPHIIYCSITGYGQTGPLFKRAGYDAVACAMSGLMHITGPEVACLTHIAANYLNGGIEAKRWGTAHGSIVPYQSFKAKDGYLVIGAGNDQQFSTVCRITDLSELIDDPRFKTNKLRVQYRKELLQVLTARFSEKSTAEWLDLFEGSGIPYGPINSIQQVFSEPQVAHNGLILEMEHPVAGKISVPGPAVRFNNFNIGAPEPPPVIGQHTVEVLKSVLGYEDNYIAELIEDKTVSQNEVQ